MKRLIAICLLLVAMTTAAIAGSGLTATIQNCILTIEVVDNCPYKVTVLSKNEKFIGASPMTYESGTFTVNIPKGNDYIELVVTNIRTGATEILTLLVK